jgi:hypothetical protein
MTKNEKTCYNCGNKNCNVFYSKAKKDYKRHFEIYEYNNFSCVNHDKWEVLKVEEIRTDNTETLENTLERIAELEKENTELKERIKWYSEQICNKECAEVWGELTKAKNHIHRLLVLLTEGKRSYAVIDEARAFLQEASE